MCRNNSRERIMDHPHRTDDDSRQFGDERKDVSEFPTFSNWLLLIVNGLMVSLFLIFVFYPAFAALFQWLGLQGLLPKVARKALRIRDHPMLIVWNLYFALGCVAAYPFFAIANRLWRTFRKTRPFKKSNKKRRII